MVTENEVNNAGRLHDYNKREGQGIPLHSVDEKDQKDLNQTNNSDKPANFSLFEIMKNKEEDKLNSLKKSGMIKDGSSKMKNPDTELETIQEEKTKSDAFTESKTIERDLTKEESSMKKLGNGNSEVASLNENSINYPFPDGILKEIHKDDLVKKLGVSGTNQSNSNLSYQQVLQMTNKTIPPIMKNLFNNSMEENTQNPQQMTYSYPPMPQQYPVYPPQPMMPPYQMPIQMPPYQVHPHYQMPMHAYGVPQQHPSAQIPNTQMPSAQLHPSQIPSQPELPQNPSPASESTANSSPMTPSQLQPPTQPESQPSNEENSRTQMTNQLPNQNSPQYGYTMPPESQYYNQMPPQMYNYQYMPPQMAYNMPPYPYQNQQMYMGNNQYMGPY